MSSKLIVVIGATGTQGGSVVETFRNDPSWTVRAVTRSTSSEKARALRAQGVSTVAADLGDPSSLDAAFEGASVIFSVTNFWGIHFDPEHQAKAKTGQRLIDLSYEVEVQQGKNVFDAAAKVKTLDRLIFSGLSHAAKWSKGKYKHVLHYDSKAVAAEYGQETYPELWNKTSVIQIGFYLENFLKSPVQFNRRDKDGVVKFLGFLGGETLLPLIATSKDTGPLTKALVEAESGKNLIAYRGLITYDEFIGLWSRTLDIPAERDTQPDISDLPPFLPIEELLEGFGYMADFGYEAWEDTTVVHPKNLGVPIELGSVEDWIKQQDWSFLK
ncbi:hypothetical protein LTR84_005231 [Exophiala bonariae]|uniref:NmrA-like domain-containing protein n=1 Tax=Exophiala bonariae TaxID=1690606 RepID=A0AAV9NSV7_9EURO|nr:hypothetical protein LTR84_005231 [Exophiala bonariae]